MTDNKFKAEYKDSVTDVIENVVLPTDYKSKILSALREQAKNTETEEPETITETTDTQETGTLEASETIPDDTKVVPIESAKPKRNNSVKRYLGIISGIAAAIVIIASILLIRNMGISNIPTTKNLNFTVASATNLVNISGARITFRNNDGEIIKNEDGTPITAHTDGNGNVSVTLPESDSYIAMISAEGYIPYEATVGDSHVYVSPVMDENTYRAVLTWENNCDLDAILTITNGDKKEQLFYFNSNIYNEENELIATLDTDSAVPGAPETITFNATDEGIFRFSVTSYSSLYNKTPDIGTSQAKVTLYKGDAIVDTFSITPDTQDNVWCVLEVKNSEVHIIDNTYSVGAIPDVY